tara:strand:+ start:1231 stop:1371 length:141 start_codon:yes stop_codon:yes gene_type:complete
MQVIISEDTGSWRRYAIKAVSDVNGIMAVVDELLTEEMLLWSPFRV